MIFRLIYYDKLIIRRLNFMSIKNEKKHIIFDGNLLNLIQTDRFNVLTHFRR